MEHYRGPESESEHRLRYRAGWQEILTAPDAVDYQLWLDHMVELTSQELLLSATPPEWAKDNKEILERWQRALEAILPGAIEPDELAGLTEAEAVEAALNIFKETIEGIGWEEVGISFTVPNVFVAEATPNEGEIEAAIIDLRHV